MKTENILKFTLPGFLLVIVFASSGPLIPVLSAQSQSSRSSVSRPMDQAIRLYHDGQDTEAMDRFMDILVKGTPSEKALANDYINKITLRMNTGVNTIKDSGTDPTTLNEVSTARETSAPHREDTGPAAAAPDEEDAERAQIDDRQTQQGRVNDKINLKIAQMRHELLLELGRTSAVKVYMGDSLPKAVTLDPEYFFSSDVAFRPGAQKLLNTLAALIFTLGKADCLLLPEGSAEGDVKIKSIRHAIAVNSFLETRGISKSRLEVNLTGTDIRFPKELTNISGMIIIFDYDKARLLKDSEDQQTKGPRVSLGIYPTAISIQKNEGAIVEFSVFEPPAGQPTWKFQIMEVRRDGTRLPLQEVSGTGPQYNQSYWNGRKKFFGVPYPSGKYIFSVTAMDSEGRDTTLSRLLLIRPSQEEEAGLARAASHKGVQRQAVTPSGIKTRTLGAKGAVSKSGKVLKGKAASLKKGKAKLAGKAAKGVKPKTKAKKKPSLDGDDGSGAKAAPESGKSPGDGAAAGGSSQVSYKIYFKENTISLTPNSEKRLAQVAETLGYYPMSNISLTGYSYSGEPDPDAMAQKRADYVASRLAAKYKIDRSRMDVKSVVSETPKSIVEIKLTGKEKE